MPENAGSRVQVHIGTHLFTSSACILGYCTAGLFTPAADPPAHALLAGRTALRTPLAMVELALWLLLDPVSVMCAEEHQLVDDH